MDTTYRAREVADLLGVPTSRVLRWCREGGVAGHKDDDGRWRLQQSVVGELVRRHGAVPTPFPEDRSRQDLLVLAALARTPRGLPSARAVGSATGLSPTTASGTVGRLAAEGLVRQHVEQRILRGRSRLMPVWYANLDAAAVQTLLPYLHRVRLPDPPASSAGRLPDHLWHLFWNADPRQIDTVRDATLIAHRAMASGDPEALAWAVDNLPGVAFSEAITYRGSPPDDVAWLRACLALERDRAVA